MQLLKNGKLDSALDKLRQSVGLAQQVKNPDEQDIEALATCYLGYGYACGKKGDWPKCETAYCNALKTWSRIHTEERYRLCQLQLEIAAICQFNKHFQKSYELLEAGHNSLVKKYGEESANVAGCLCQMGTVQAKLSNGSQSDKHFEAAIAILQKNKSPMVERAARMFIEELKIQNRSDKIKEVQALL